MIMKALPMLDYAMLWVARFFSLSLVMQESTWITTVVYSPITRYAVYAYLILYLLWAISCWFLSKSSIRLFLGLSAALASVAMIYLITAGLISVFNPHDILCVSYIFGGLVSLIWIAGRGPRIAPRRPQVVSKSVAKHSTFRIFSHWLPFLIFRHSAGHPKPIY
jgi:hypothetical protein